MKKSKIFASLFIMLGFGIFVSKLTGNFSLDDIKNNVVVAKAEVDNSRVKDDIISKDLTTIINGVTSTIDTEGDGIETNVTLIDDISDFALMNGSSGHFKLTKNITVPNSVTSLGIETFAGVFNGGGYTISNLKGPFIKELSGTICNFVIDSPREFTGTLDGITTTKTTISNTLYGFITKNDNTQVAIQNFGFACGKVTTGTIDNVKVNNAKINTNGSTEGKFASSINTTGYMGFVVGHAHQNSYITNCSVSNSTLVHSSAYGVGGIVGYSYQSYIRGCLVNNMTVTGKNGLAINTMPKAFTGLLVGVSFRGSLNQNIIADISQTSTPYLSFLGAALYYKNTGVLGIRETHYDETVADFSKPGFEEGYEQVIQIDDDPINSSNATVDTYGHVYDIDESSLGYYRTLAITDVYRYTSTPLSSIISDYNSKVKVGNYALPRNTSTYDISNYVADDEKILAFNLSISDDITYGDYLQDKVTLEVDTSKTNFETKVIFQYKFEGSSTYSDLTEETIVNKLAGEYRILYLKDGFTTVIEGAGGTFNAKPFDVNNAVININPRTYIGKEQSVGLSVRTPSGLNLTYTTSGTTKATDVGVYDVVITGNSNTTGTITKQWEIKKGTMTLSSSNINQIYDGNYHSIKVTAPDNTTLTYSTDGVEYTSTNPSFKDVGTYTVYYKGSNPNYEDGSGSATITIKPLGLKVTWGETSLVYNGEEQIPSVTLGNIKGDDVVNITGMSGHAINEGNNYTATILGVDNPNYQLPSEPYIKFKITPIIIDVPSISSKEYTGEILYADVDESEGYTIEGIYYGTHVGEYKFSLTPHANHAWTGGTKHTLSYTFEITKATNEWIIPPSIESWTYGQPASELIFQSKFGSPGVRYYNAETNEPLQHAPTEAGNYIVTVTTANTNNFNSDLNETLSFTIYKADPTYEVPTNLTAIYGNTLNDIILPSDENGTWSFKEDVNTLLDEVKEYTFTLVYTPKDTNNYNTIEEEVIVNVLKADITYTAPTIISELTYNGTEQALINVGSTNDGTFEYKIDDGEYSSNIPTAKDAKTYTVYYRIIGDANHNNVEEQSLQVNISPLKVNIIDVTINDAHINENGYEFDVSNVTFDAELTTNDYEVSSITLTGNNEVGTQNVDVVINITNTNYELVSNNITSTVNINDHESNVDDGDCTTAVTCKHCDYVFIEASLVHESQEDDNDCTTEVKCKHCEQVVIEARPVHESQDDDNDCTTEVKCKHCEHVVVDAKTHSLSSTYTKDKDGHYTHCENENCEYVTSKENHVSSGEASEEAAEVCTICEYIITPALNHTHSNKGSLLSNDTHHYYECSGCEEKLEYTPHSFTIFTKIDETSHKEACVCGQEKVNSHTYGDWVINKNPSENEKGSKTKTCPCGHAIIEDIPATGSTNPPKEPANGLSTGAIIGIVIGSITLLGLAICAIFWFVIKKRNFADLIKLFKRQ